MEPIIRGRAQAVVLAGLAASIAVAAELHERFAGPASYPAGHDAVGRWLEGERLDGNAVGLQDLLQVPGLAREEAESFLDARRAAGGRLTWERASRALGAPTVRRLQPFIRLASSPAEVETEGR